jgi:hypothetical protein
MKWDHSLAECTCLEEHSPMARLPRGASLMSFLADNQLVYSEFLNNTSNWVTTQINEQGPSNIMCLNKVIQLTLT